MDIDKLFKDKIYEGQAPVEDSLWSDIEAKLNTPSANASPTQTAGAKSFISQTWQAMTIGAKVVTSVVAVALVSTAVVSPSSARTIPEKPGAGDSARIRDNNSA